MGTPVVRCHDLDVLVVPAAVGLHVLDAQVREMHLVVEIREVLFGGPRLNLLLRPFWVAVVVVVVPVVLVEPALVVALQLVVEDDALDVGPALAEPLLGLLVGAVDLQVVLAFARADEAGVEGLAAFSDSVSR